MGPEFLVNEHLTSDQRGSDVAADPAGNFVVVWSSNNDYYGPQYDDVVGRVYDRTGAPVGGEFQVNTYTTWNVFPFAAVGASGAGRFVVAWDSNGQDGSGRGIFGRRFVLPPIFSDGFESGDTSGWDATVP